MSSHQQIGAFLMFAGGVAVAIGLLVWVGAFRWFGRLPGDIRIEREELRVYVPVMSMLLISVVLSLLLKLFGKLMR
jgi:hypothetical protein